MRHDGVDIDRAHPLADRPLHAQQAETILIFHQLADRTHAAIAEIVDIVDFAAAVLEVDQHLQDRQHVLLAQHANLIVGGEAQPGIHLDAADGRQVIAFLVEEQAVEQGLGRFQGRRLARAHDAVNIDQRVLAGRVAVDRHGVAQIAADRDVVDGEQRQFLDAGGGQLFQIGDGDFVAGFIQHDAVALIDHVGGEIAAGQLLGADELILEPAFLQLLDHARSHLGADFGDDGAGIGIDQLMGELDALHAVGIEQGGPTGAGAAVIDRAVERRQDLLAGHAVDLRPVGLAAGGLALFAIGLGLGRIQRIEQGRHRQLAAAIDAHIDMVLGVEFEIEPGAAIGDDAGGEQIFARGVGLALVMVEEDARRAVHLADDDAFSAVDDERAVRRHQRHVHHIDILFLDVADRAQARLLIDIEHRQSQRHLQRRGIGHAPLLALIDIVFRLLQLVAHEIEFGAIREVADRKDGTEHFLETGDYTVFGAHVHLQEFFIGTALNLDEVRHLDHFRDASEGLADTLTTGERARGGFCHNAPQSRCERKCACIKRATGRPESALRQAQPVQKTVCNTNGNTMPPGETLRFAPAGHREINQP